MKVSKPKSIFFDWDGTLVDTIPGLRMAHNYVRTSLGYEPWSEAEFWENMHYSGRELYPRLFGERTEDAFALLTDFFDKRGLEFLSPLDGAESLLKCVAKLGLRAGIVSNKRHAFLLREVKHLGWDRYLPVAVGAGFTERDKPAGEPITKAFELSGVERGDFASSWFVGDTETDMLAARNAGCQAVLVLYGKQKDNLITTYKPALVAANCHEIEAFLLS